jgi:diguanylate cyclase (GGDEF)-like protein
MEEIFDEILDLFNLGIAMVIFVMAIRIVISMKLALHRRSTFLFMTAAGLFALQEIASAIPLFFIATEELDLIREIIETAFILCLLGAMYLAFHSEKQEINVLEERAEIDHLTRLKNIGQFRQAAARRIEAARQQSESLTLLMLDIDDFKAYNDRFGHEAGNFALQAVAHTLRAVARSGDLLARYGGEEFVVLMPIRPGDALPAAERFCDRVAELCSPENNPHLSRQVTVSIGMATLKDPVGTLEELIESADRALYCAKKNGKNRVAAGACPEPLELEMDLEEVQLV